MQLPTEILRAEILDWWEEEREKIARDIHLRLPTLLHQVDKIIDDNAKQNLTLLGQTFSFNRYELLRDVEAVVSNWLERAYIELTHVLDQSFRVFIRRADVGKTCINWSYSYMGTTYTGTYTTSAAQMIVDFSTGQALEFARTASCFFLPRFGLYSILSIAETVAVVTGLTTSTRSRAVSILKSQGHKMITEMVLGDSKDGTDVTLKHVLFSELQGFVFKQMEMAL